MNADEIVRLRQADWGRLEVLVSRGGVRAGRLDPTELVELSNLYRAAAADAARVRGAGADDGTVAYLDGLLARAHNELYRAPPPRRAALALFVSKGFPQAVRRNAWFVLWASLAFYGPFLFGLVAAVVVPPFAPAVMGEQQMDSFRHMYDEVIEKGRSVGEGSLMVGFYVQHNTSIAFQVFANGVFFGLGSVFMLVYQGLAIGTVFGFLIGDDKGRQILTFTCGHSAWELTAIVLSGSAGLRMGWALVVTEGRTRTASLRAAGPEVARLVGGAAMMLSVAAFIEGLWSPSSVPAEGKVAFALLQILFVANYLSMIGRDATEPLPASSAFRVLSLLGLGPVGLLARQAATLPRRLLALAPGRTPKAAP